MEINRAKTSQYHPLGAWNILNLPKVSYYNVRFGLPGLFLFSLSVETLEGKKLKAEK